MQRAEVESTMDAYAVEVASSWERTGRRLVDLAAAMGVSPSYISRLRGRRTGLGLRSAIGLSKTLGASVEELERRALAWHAAGRPLLGPEALTGAQGGAK